MMDQTAETFDQSLHLFLGNLLMSPRWLACFITLVFFIGCDRAGLVAPLAHEDLDAALWMRTSAEFQVLATDAFQRAMAAVTEGLNDPTWSALPDQSDWLLASIGENLAPLPPAVIVDVDETVLDTSAYQVRQILQEGQYQTDTWNRWVAEMEATLVPGALEFVQGCQQSGVTVFFVTNRDVSVERYTRRNLEELELIKPHAVDNILSKNERDDWTVDKSSRRDYVAKRFRVLAIVGDDLNDFLWVGDEPTVEARRELAAKYHTYWGQKWFLLPNPNYGNWERAIVGYDDTIPVDEKRLKKRERLREGLEDLPDATPSHR